MTDLLQPSDVLFDSDWYLDTYPDVRRELHEGMWADPFEHYRVVGLEQARDPNPLFSESLYREVHLDVAEAITDGSVPSGIQHYLLSGAGENRWFSPWFHADWYLATHPQAHAAVAAGNCSTALEHFLLHGLSNGLVPAPEFDGNRYLRHNPGAASDIERRRLSGPFEHLVRRGLQTFARSGFPPPHRPRREAFVDSAQRALAHFLAGTDRLQLPAPDQASVSVILVLHNQPGLALRCFEALARFLPADAEVIAVDNASGDQTQALLDRIDGLRLFRNPENRNFLSAANQGALAARGHLLLFLNSDAIIEPGAVEEARATFQLRPRVGIVGARLLHFHGALQEAGATFDPRGNPIAVGRDDVATDPAYQHLRTAAYCSGAFLMTPSRLFQDLGGFDELFLPAYFEDADYCFRARRAGFETIFQPKAIVWHLEHGSSEGGSVIHALFRRNRILFLDRHGAEVERLHRRYPEPWETPSMEVPAGNGRRILILDDRLPLIRYGSGFPRAGRLVQALHDQGWHITLLPTQIAETPEEDLARELPGTVERLPHLDPEQVRELLLERRGLYDVIWASRPNNMRLLAEACDREPGLFRGTRLVYDAEALYALRESRRPGKPPSSVGMLRYGIRQEVRLANVADQVVTVSEGEADHFRNEGHRVSVLGHALEPNAPRSMDLDRRRDLLFVGPFHANDTPNHDGLCWFLVNVWPLLRQAEPQLHLHVIGEWSGLATQPSSSEGSVHFHGHIKDLEPHYQAARLFLAPIRFGAGIPLKILEAAAHGLPVVTTDVTNGLLGWKHGDEILAAPVAEPAQMAREVVRLLHDTVLWRRLSRAALRRVTAEASPKQFADTVRRIVSGSTESPDHSAAPADDRSTAPDTPEEQAS